MIGGFVMTGYRQDNPNWRGGITVTAHGYVLVKVGKDHHLADVRGYAYEHRIVAEEKMGRLLQPDELVHHLNGNRQDNHPDNVIVTGIAEHIRLHIGNPMNRQLGETNPMMSCACGCGTMFLKYDTRGRPRKYICGHNNSHA